MYKSLSADKDAYITNKIVNSVPVVSSNIGLAASLDLFKLYGITKTSNINNTELSRLLIHFDLQQLKDDVSAGIVDVNDSSFWCKISLKDVFGGQTNPVNFNIDLYPLSASFEEGLGKDSVYYSDKDSCNWLSSSFGKEWFLPGCSLSTTASSPGDYITGSTSFITTKSTQFFKSGTEDLLIDVTKILSSTLSKELPDQGFRLSFNSELEKDNRTYFVKRFGSRHAYDENKRPQLIYGYNDSISDDTLNLVFDASCSINLYNYVQGQVKNIVSSSSEILGNNSLIFKLSTEYPSGSYNLYYSGSQFSRGINHITGVYNSVFVVPSNDPVISLKILESGSVKFHTQWVSNDLSVVYSTGDDVTVRKPNRTSTSQGSSKFQVSVTGTQTSYFKGNNPELRVNIFDRNTPVIKVVNLPVDLPGVVLKNVFYSIRDAVTKEIVVPFDDTMNSTKVSSDASGMFFTLYTSSLTSGRVYIVDIMLSLNGSKLFFPSASTSFRID